MGSTCRGRGAGGGRRGEGRRAGNGGEGCWAGYTQLIILRRVGRRFACRAFLPPLWWPVSRKARQQHDAARRLAPARFVAEFMLRLRDCWLFRLFAAVFSFETGNKL